MCAAEAALQEALAIAWLFMLDWHDPDLIDWKIRGSRGRKHGLGGEMTGTISMAPVGETGGVHTSDCPGRGLGKL